jgi:hypothetical protein
MIHKSPTPRWCRTCPIAPHCTCRLGTSIVSSLYNPPAGTARNTPRHVPSAKVFISVHGVNSTPVSSFTIRASTRCVAQVSFVTVRHRPASGMSATPPVC